MMRRLRRPAVWLAGAVALGWGLWPSHRRPWPVPADRYELDYPPGSHAVVICRRADGSTFPYLPDLVSGPFERFDLLTGELQATVPGPGVVRYDPGDTMTVGVLPVRETAEAPLIILDPATGRELFRHAGPGRVFRVGEPADGLYAVADPIDFTQPADPRYEVHVHDAATGRRLRTLPGQIDWWPVARGRLLATIRPHKWATDRRLHLWDVTDGREVGSAPAGEALSPAALDADGRTLADDAGTIWDMTTGRPIARVAPPDMRSQAGGVATADDRWVVGLTFAGSAVARFDRHERQLVSWPDLLPALDPPQAGSRSLQPRPVGRSWVAVTRSHSQPQGRLLRWVGTNVPGLTPLAADATVASTHMLDVATGEIVWRAPVDVTGVTDDGTALFVGDGATRHLWVRDTGFPWLALAAVAGWTLAVIAFRRRSHRPLTAAA